MFETKMLLILNHKCKYFHTFTKNINNDEKYQLLNSIVLLRLISCLK